MVLDDFFVIEKGQRNHSTTTYATPNVTVYLILNQSLMLFLCDKHYSQITI